MKFEFATATRIVFGPGSIKDIGRYAADLGQHVFIVTGRNTDRAAPVVQLIKNRSLGFTLFSVSREPTTDLALTAVARARQAACDMVVGIGGGSVIDTGKVVASLLTNKGELMDYLEVIGKGQPLNQKPAPYIAIPTTAGTGAEVARNAVLESPKHRVKVSMRSHLMLPRIAVVDPELTYSMPPAVTASTGLDAFTQLLEAFVSKMANPLTDGICREGLSRASRSLERAYLDGHDASAREDMSLASLFGGLALANAKLGAVHGFAGPLGGMFAAPHGALCATLLPHVMEANIQALKSRAPESLSLKRYDEVAEIIIGRSNAGAIDGISWVKELCSTFEIPPLSDYGINEADFSMIVAKSRDASSMKGNPVMLTEEELFQILQKAM
jgi:alcohol dehydrogenase class IV